MNGRRSDSIVVRMAIGAVNPWKSPDAKSPVNFNRLVDSQEQIEKCLSCSKCDCTNCLHGRKSTYVSKKLASFQPIAETR